MNLLIECVCVSVSVKCMVKALDPSIHLHVMKGPAFSLPFPLLPSDALLLISRLPFTSHHHTHTTKKCLPSSRTSLCAKECLVMWGMCVVCFHEYVTRLQKGVMRLNRRKRGTLFVKQQLRSVRAELLLFVCVLGKGSRYKGLWGSVCRH